MKKLLLVLLLAVMALGIIAEAQETVPNQGTYFPQPGNRKFDGDVWITGTLYRGTAKTDWIVWYPAIHSCAGWDGTAELAPKRVAQFDWAITVPASKTANIVCTLNLPTRTATSAGAKITSIDISYRVTGANLTSLTWDGVRSITYATAAANAIAAFGGTVTFGTAQTISQVTPYLTSATFGTPAFVNTADRSIIVEFTPVTPGSSIFDLYGIAVHYSLAF